MHVLDGQCMEEAVQHERGWVKAGVPSLCVIVDSFVVVIVYTSIVIRTLEIFIFVLTSTLNLKRAARG